MMVGGSVGGHRDVRIVIYEWCCSGGLHGPDRAEPGGTEPDGNGPAAASASVPADGAGLPAEGRAMFTALVRDVAKDDGFEAVALVDAAWTADPPQGVRLCRVECGGEIEVLVEKAADSDAAIIVAPETGGILARRVAAVRAAGGRPLAASSAFIALATDKQATIAALAAAGVPVPAGRSLAAGQAWPEGFRRPAVRKARAAAGCDGLV
ncbi:MAG: hypothetical protein EBZ59_02805, partial [Planctomycetia bacterium]|nr:hypothetical protein [Planctomycetia bacterium]